MTKVESRKKEVSNGIFRMKQGIFRIVVTNGKNREKRKFFAELENRQAKGVLGRGHKRLIGIAKCHPEDIFIPKVGINMAVVRLLKQIKAERNNELKRIIIRHEKNTKAYFDNVITKLQEHIKIQETGDKDAEKKTK